MEPLGVHARGDHRSLLRLKAVVAGVLLLGLLLRARDHQGRLGQGPLLGIDATANGIGLLDLLMGQPALEQAPLFLAAEGMAGEDQGDTKPLGDQRPHIAGIGVVGMDPIRPLRLGRNVRRDGIGHLIEIGPEQFLAQIAPRTAGQAHDVGPAGQRLMGLGVIGGDPLVLNQPGNDVDALHLRASRQSLGQLKHVGGLSTGIRITSKLQVMAAKQAMQMEMQQVVAHSPPRRLAHL